MVAVLTLNKLCKMPAPKSACNRNLYHAAFDRSQHSGLSVQ